VEPNDARAMESTGPEAPRRRGTGAGVEEELRRSLARLRASEAQFRTLVESTSDIIHVIDEDRVIRYMSPACERLLGYKPEELVGTVGSDLLLPDVHADAARIVGEIMSEGPPDGRGAIQRLRHKDGSWKSFEVTGARILDADGRPTLVAVSRDVTEREQLAAERRAWEERRHQAQQLETVGRLAGGLAHDFNNLFVAIQGRVQLLLDDISERHPMHEDLVEIRRSTQRAAHLTHQLLAFSQKQCLQPVPLDLAAIVADMREALSDLLGDSVTLSTDIPDGLRRIEADPTQIEEVLTSLVSNARDAMPEGGRLTIAAANAEIDAESAGGLPETVAAGPYVAISVRDTGVGMDKQTVARIFDPFFTTKEVGRGIGLGLASVYGIVRQSGGRVAVESEPGRGTTFTVYLPG
jgi:PAS domain S-box-containing protein